MIVWNTDTHIVPKCVRLPAGVLLAVATLLLDGPVVIVPLVLACLWIWGRPEGRPRNLAVAACLMAGQSINVSLGMIDYELTPFMAGQGYALLERASDTAFPSDHTALCWSCGLGLIFTHGAVRWAAVLCMLGMLTGCARVYLGVHYPLDVLVASPIGLLAGAGARVALPLTTSLAFAPVERLYEGILAHLPSALSLPHRYSCV